jgi:cell division protein FtsB
MSAAKRPAAKRPPAKRAAAPRPAAKRSAAKRSAAKRPAATRPAATRPAAKGPAAKKAARTPRKDSRLRRLAGGDRPFLAALVVLVVAMSVLALGPLQRYTAAADRVEGLEATRDALAEQVDELEDRKAILSDPEELEIIARTELGLVKPGEIPFIVVSPEDRGTDQVRPRPPEPAEAQGGPWYRRLGRALAGLFDV